jgi:putative membrane protein insertion efficiency factor
VPAPGDTRRMGHCDTPEECGAARGIYNADHRLAAHAEERAECADHRQELTTRMGRNPAKQSLPVRAALFALRFYKSYFSVLFAGNCRFTPTCSVYAYEAIDRFGVVHGAWLGAKRLTRCQPFSRKYGFDPIPEVCTPTMSTEKTRPVAGFSAENTEAAS